MGGSILFLPRLYNLTIHFKISISKLLFFSGIASGKLELSEKKMKKYEYIDVLRGLAILGVIAVHSSQDVPNLWIGIEVIYGYGQLGVQLFFFASAITLYMSMENRPNTSILSFYNRRFFRIAPLAYLAMVFYFCWNPPLTYVAADVLGIQYRTTGIVDIHAVSYIDLIQSITFTNGFSPSNFNSYILPGGWSISVEMSFYAILPFLYFYTKSLNNSKLITNLLLIIIFLLLCQFVLIYIFIPTVFSKNIYNNGFSFLYASIFNQIGVFLIGIISYRFLYKPISLKLKLLSVLLIIVSIFLRSKNELFFGMNGAIYPLLSAISFSIIAISLSNVRNFESGILKIIISLGQHSFSMYICHFFVLDIIRLIFKTFGFYEAINSNILVFIVCILALLITYFFSRITLKYVEYPGIQLGKKVNNKFLKKELQLN